jgi:hypothetical protein
MYVYEHVFLSVDIMEYRVTLVSKDRKDVLSIIKRVTCRTDVLIDGEYADVLGSSRDSIAPAIRRLALDQRDVATAMNIFRETRGARLSGWMREIFDDTNTRKELGEKHVTIWFLDFMFEPYVHFLRNKVRITRGHPDQETKDFVNNVLRDARAFRMIFEGFLSSRDIVSHLNAWGCRVKRDESGSHRLARAIARSGSPLAEHARRQLDAIAGTFPDRRRQDFFPGVARAWKAAWQVLDRTYVAARVLSRAAHGNVILVADNRVLKYVSETLKTTRIYSL